MKYNISFSCISHIGNLRKINQDNFVCDRRFMENDANSIVYPLNGIKSSNELSVFGIFDGMGGEECGEIASYLAAKNATNIQISKNMVSELSRFCQKANEDICNYAKKNGVRSMGTTAAMLVFTNKEVTLCNIGDSKIFRFYDGILEQISKDHVSVSAYGIKPPLSQNLGIPPDEMIIEPYFAKGSYNNDDIYLMCSDGLTDMVATDKIIEVLASKTINEAITELLDEALSNGGRDNITIILCKVKHESGWLYKRKIHTKKKEV